MKILLHICCAPCAIYPLQQLRKEGAAVTGFFFNHNIHPYQEYRRRLEAVREYAGLTELQVIYHEEYLLDQFLGAVAAAPADRCSYCYVSRMEEAAKSAAEHTFDAFSTSLLYSRYQQHDLIRELGEKMGQKYNVRFFYQDFRQGWQEGIQLSKKLNLYRQQYCGCIYSERDRYICS